VPTSAADGVRTGVRADLRLRQDVADRPSRPSHSGRASAAAELITDVFGLPCQIIVDPVSQTPMVVPIGRHLHVATEVKERT
jgi:hypothetical protein